MFLNKAYLILIPSLLATYSVAGSFVDKRDGRTYKTVKIGTQTWMAENLKFKVYPSFCYQKSEANCQKYGRMYPWHVAMKLPAKKAYDDENVRNFVNEVHQGICPTGWHVPSVSEFDSLYAQALAGDESPSTKKLSTDPTERFILNPQGFNLKYGGLLMIYGFEYYRGFKEIDPTAAARFYKSGKSGEYPLTYLFKDLNHVTAFTTTDAEDAATRHYAAYSDQYNFEMTSSGVYRGASADYLRCIKDFECPKGEEFYEGICQKPFDCLEDRYAVDKWNCEFLPKNAHKKKGIGFECDKGFDKVKEDDEYVCKERANCDEYEYAVDKWNCKILPDNAHKNKGFGFSCDKGYSRVTKDDDIECMKPYGCKESEYAIDKFECMPLPENAHRRANEKTGYECDEGYDSIEIGLFSYCRKPYKCKEDEFSLDKYKCEKLPQNAHRNEELGFTCNEGYDEIHDDNTISCEKGYVCAEMEYAVDVKNCAPLPDFATRNEKEGFSCNDGYALYQGECYPISPESY